MFKRCIIALLVLASLSTYTNYKNTNIRINAYEDEAVQVIFTETVTSIENCIKEPVVSNIDSNNEGVLNVDETSLSSNERDGESQTEQMISSDAAYDGLKLETNNEATFSSKSMTIENTPKASTQSEYNLLINDTIVRLNQLELASNHAIEELLLNAKQDYAIASSSERTSLEFKSRLVAKYMELANELEKIVDQAVFSVLADLKINLTQSGYPLESIDTLSQQYAQEKLGRKKEILDQVFSRLDSKN